MRHNYTETSREERIAIINRIRKVKGQMPSVSLVMTMWILTEIEARQLLAEAAKVEE